MDRNAVTPEFLERLNEANRRTSDAIVAAAKARAPPTPGRVYQMLQEYVQNGERPGERVLNLNNWSIIANDLEQSKLNDLYPMLAQVISTDRTITQMFVADNRLKGAKLEEFLRYVLPALRNNPSITSVQLMRLEHNSTTLGLIAESLVRGNASLQDLRISVFTGDSGNLVKGPGGITDRARQDLANAIRQSVITQFIFADSWGMGHSASTTMALDHYVNGLTAKHRQRVDTCNDREFSVRADPGMREELRAMPTAEAPWAAAARRASDAMQTGRVAEEQRRAAELRFVEPTIANPTPEAAWLVELRAAQARHTGAAGSSTDMQVDTPAVLAAATPARPTAGAARSRRAHSAEPRSRPANATAVKGDTSWMR